MSDFNNDSAGDFNQEDQDWAAAVNDFRADKGLEPEKPVTQTKEEDKGDDKNNQRNDDVQADANKDAAKSDEASNGSAKSGEDSNVNDAKGSGEESDAEKTEDNDSAQANEYTVPQRSTREIAEDRRVTVNDIREKLYPDFTTEVTDADGDPLRTAADVMKLRNPNTGKAFTAEEATLYLMQAQDHLDRENAKAAKHIEEVAEVNLTIKEEANNVRARWGKLLAARPDLKQSVFANFSKTLTRDEKTNIITKAPISMEDFYNMALSGYEQAADQLQKNEESTAEKAKTEAEEKQKKQKVEARQDRQDIYGGGKTETMDKEEKEWADAAKDYYEGKIR